MWCANGPCCHGPSYGRLFRSKSNAWTPGYVCIDWLATRSPIWPAALIQPVSNLHGFPWTNLLNYSMLKGIITEMIGPRVWREGTRCSNLAEGKQVWVWPMSGLETSWASYECHFELHSGKKKWNAKCKKLMNNYYPMTFDVPFAPVSRFPAGKFLYFFPPL